MIPPRQTKTLRALIEIDAEGEVVEITPEAQRTVGWRPGDLVSQRVMDELKSDSACFTVFGLADRHVLLRSYQAGERSGWLLMVEDDTPLLDDAVFLEGDLSYRAFFEQAPIGIAHLDRDGLVTFENHALRQIIGEGLEDAWIGRSIFSVKAFDRFLLPLVQRMIWEGLPFDAGESMFAEAPGPERCLRISGMPIRNADGAVAGGVMTIQDISDLKAAERVMEQSARDAQAASRMKTALIATMSHELRTPVGTIRGYAAMLEDELARPSSSPQRMHEFASVIRERARDLETLVSDLIEFAHLEAGLIRPQVQRTFLAPLVTGVVESVTAKYENPVRTVVEADADVSCHADVARLRSVLARIVDNALKFTPKGYVKVTASASGGMARIGISDTGIGMDPDYVRHIFDPFSQAEPVLSRSFEGAGLGLALARRVLEIMGGTIEVDSSPGEGTSVTIDLPMFRDPQEEG